MKWLTSSMISKRLFYGYFFLWGISYLIYHFSGIGTLWKFLWAIMIYFLIFYIIYWSFKSITRKEPIGFVEFFIVFLYKLSVFLSIIFLLGGFFTYYQNNISPAKMPLYTLSNGEKTLKFQTMSHIARQKFYTAVQLQISRAKRQDFVLFYEWVRPWSEENKLIFDTALGVEISPDFYETFAKVYGVSHQENEDFLNIVNSQDFNVDLDIDTIVELYLGRIDQETKTQYDEIIRQKSLPQFVQSWISEDKANIDIQQELLSRLTNLNENQLSVLRYINKSILNFIIKHEWLREFIVQKVGLADIFGVILDDRNIFVAQEIITSEFENIFVIYGLMHFDGIFELLQKTDPNWKIIETEYSYPISERNLPWN